LARELGISVAPSTILRWVVGYVPEFEKCWQAYERPVGDSWRVDETYLKVGGQWMYLYRAVDKQGKTIESYLSRTRDVTAAKAFFRKALKRHGEPRVITLDGFEATMPLCAAWAYATEKRRCSAIVRSSMTLVES
jgi:transposase-like protein